MPEPRATTQSATDARLARECASFLRYLIDAEPSAALAARYVDAHRRGVVEPESGADAFDRALVALARTGSLGARLCDAHARLFRPAGLLRRKLVLTLALAEVDAAAHGAIDQPRGRSSAGAWLSLCGGVLLFGLSVVVGIALLLPVRLACAFAARPGREPRRSPGGGP